MTPTPNGIRNHGGVSSAVKQTPQDDIATLCSQAGLSLDGYKTFRRQSPEPPAEAAERVESRQNSHPPAPVLNQRDACLTAWREPNPQRWHALHSVLDGASALESASRDNSTTAAKLPAGSLSMIPAGGGVGVSTILATLGRIFAQRRERVLLLDGTPSTILPFYFGVTAAVPGTCLLQQRLTTVEYSIRVVSRKVDQGAAGTRESDTSLWETVGTLLGEVDRVFVEVWDEMSADVRRQLWLESNSLVVLVPDLRSVLRVRTLLQLFHEQQRIHGRSCMPYFLLNQFDPSVPLHQDLRRSLAGQLGERLLPFTLRRTDEVTLALAEGTTVMDYAPNSGIAEDFLQLANWLAMWQGTNPDPRHKEIGA